MTQVYQFRSYWKNRHSKTSLFYANKPKILSNYKNSWKKKINPSKSIIKKVLKRWTCFNICTVWKIACFLCKSMLLREEDDRLNNPTAWKSSTVIRNLCKNWHEETGFWKYSVRACGLLPTYVMIWNSFHPHRYSKLEQVWLSNLTCFRVALTLKVALVWAGNWSRWPPEVSSMYSVILYQTVVRQTAVGLNQSSSPCLLHCCRFCSEEINAHVR